MFQSFFVRINTLRFEIFLVAALLYEHTDPFIHHWLDSHQSSDYCGLGQGELKNLNSPVDREPLCELMAELIREFVDLMCLKKVFDLERSRIRRGS